MYKKTQNSQLTINNFPPFRVGENKIVSVKVALSIGAVVLHKTQCLRFLIRDLHLITTSPHHHIITLSHHHIIPHQFPHRFKANEFRQLCSLKKKIFAYKKTQNSQLTINNFPPFRVGENKIVSVKVALSIGAVVLHKTQCLRFLIRDLHLITTSPHHHISHHPASFSTLLQSE